MVHGITNAVDGGSLCVGTKCATIFPAGAGQGASFNESAWRVMGEVAATEMRALNNINWGPVARPGVGMDALVSWGPTINLQRDPRCRTSLLPSRAWRKHAAFTSTYPAVNP
jgi:beta-glucosidase-like glycosyl hydrolase